MEGIHEMKEGSMSVISPLNASATVAAVRDEEGHACMMLSGDSPSIMGLIENMAVAAIMSMYKRSLENGSEENALGLLTTSGKLLHKHIMERLLSETVKDKVKRECKGMPDELAGILAKALERRFAEEDDGEGEEGED